MTKENLIEKIKSLIPNDTELEIRHNGLFVHNDTKYLLWEVMNDGGVLWVDYESSGNICTYGRICCVLSDFDTEIVQHILDAVQANKENNNFHGYPRRISTENGRININ